MDPEHPSLAARHDELQKLQHWIDRAVVVDTLAYHVYIGTLVSIDGSFIELTNVDVHDVRESRFTKDQYVHQARKHGNSPNRNNTLVYKHQCVSLSLLEDIIQF